MMASPAEQEDISLKKMACELLQQSLTLVEKLTDTQYTKNSTVMPGGTIGKHLRHVNDHFHLLYKQYNKNDTINASASERWIVDYDIRSRNSPSETNRSIISSDLNDLQTLITQCTMPLDTEVTLLAAIDPTDSHKYPFKSTYGRELLYSCIHAIHHYASIKAICIEQGISISDKFGVAPSTLLYNSERELSNNKQEE